jgi:hypothetical protein
VFRFASNAPGTYGHVFEYGKDGTLLEAWAGQKSFRRVDDDRQAPASAAGDGSNPTVNFHCEKRSNQTHCSTTDPDAMLARKSRGTGAVLAYRGHLLTENRNGLVVSTLTTRAYGSAERDAGLLMAEGLPGTHRVTLGADKGYDARDFVAELRHMDRVVPVGRQTGRCLVIGLPWSLFRVARFITRYKVTG